MKNFRIFRKNSLNGFTLIEMMVAMVIATLLAAIAIPYFWGSYLSMELKGSARTVASVLRSAKSYAEAQNIKYEVNFYKPANNQLVITMFKDPEGTPIQVGKSERLRLSSNIVFTVSTFPNKDADADRETYFTPQGTCDGGTVRINNTAKSKRIDVTVSGNTARIKVGDIISY